MQLELGRFSNALSYLVDQVEVHHALCSSSSAGILSASFLSFVRTSTFFDQVRLLDLSGQELIRADYNDGHPRLAAKSALQNKADRYYFREGLKLKRGDAYVSRFDLNIEHGRIEQPIKPVIRLVQPVFDADGHRFGMVVVNALGRSLLALAGEEDKSEAVHVSLLNRDGYWMVGPNRKDLWAFMYPGRACQASDGLCPSGYSG